MKDIVISLSARFSALDIRILRVAAFVILAVAPVIMGSPGLPGDVGF